MFLHRSLPASHMLPCIAACTETCPVQHMTMLSRCSPCWPCCCCPVQAHVSSQFLEDHLFVLQPVASGQQQLSPRVVHLALQVCASYERQQRLAMSASTLYQYICSAQTSASLPMLALSSVCMDEFLPASPLSTSVLKHCTLQPDEHKQHQKAQTPPHGRCPLPLSCVCRST